MKHDINKGDRPVSDSGIYQRLELIKHLGNAQLNYLKSLHDGSPIWERYLKHEVRLHIHCIFPRVCLACATVPANVNSLFRQDDEATMLVEVGEFAEQTQTLPSIVRLAFLDHCDMYIADAFEKAIPPTDEDIMSVFNRKLDLIAHRITGILLSQGASDVVQGGAQGIGEFPDVDSDARKIFLKPLFQIFASGVQLRIIGTGADGIQLVSAAAKFFQPRQMFFCPIEQGVDFFDLIQHMQGVLPRRCSE